MRDFEQNTKNIVGVYLQTLAAGVASTDDIAIETKGSRNIKARIIASGVAAGKIATFVLKGGDDHDGRNDNTILTLEGTADANGRIDATGYVSVPKDVYRFVTGAITPAADAGDNGYYAVDLEFGNARHSENIVEPEVYSA